MSEAKKHPLVEALTNPDSEIEPELRPDKVTNIAPALKDSGKPSYDLQKEMPWHRTLAYMLLRGDSAITAGKALSKTPEHIRQVKKQPWFKILLTELAQLNNEDVMTLLEGSTVEAILTLTELASDAKSETVRRASASDLLDKFLKNREIGQSNVPDDPKDELDQINREIELLKEQNKDEH